MDEDNDKLIIEKLEEKKSSMDLNTLFAVSPEDRKIKADAMNEDVSSFDFSMFLMSSDIQNKNKRNKKIGGAIAIYVVICLLTVLIGVPMIGHYYGSVLDYIPKEYISEYFSDSGYNMISHKNKIVLRVDYKEVVDTYNLTDIYYFYKSGEYAAVMYFADSSDARSFSLVFEDIEGFNPLENYSHNNYYYKRQGLMMVLGSEAALSITDLTAEEWTELERRIQEDEDN